MSIPAFFLIMTLFWTLFLTALLFLLFPLSSSFSYMQYTPYIILYFRFYAHTLSLSLLSRGKTTYSIGHR